MYACSNNEKGGKGKGRSGRGRGKEKKKTLFFCFFGGPSSSGPISFFSTFSKFNQQIRRKKKEERRRKSVE